MYSQMERRQSISLFHIDLFSGDSGPNLWQVPNTVAAVKNKKRICFKKKNKNRSLHYIKVSLKDECMRNIHSYIPYRLVMELDMATAVQTPLPLPDMSSPSSNFVYFSFISSISSSSIDFSSITCCMFFMLGLLTDGERRDGATAFDDVVRLVLWLRACGDDT